MAKTSLDRGVYIKYDVE